MRSKLPGSMASSCVSISCRSEVNCNCELSWKDQVVGGVDAAQVQMIFHAFAQGGEGLGIQFGHQEQGRAGIEAVALHGHLPAAPAGFFAFLHHRHLAAVARQAGGRGDPADAGADNQRFRF